jgi:hypothetical protein
MFFVGLWKDNGKVFDLVNITHMNVNESEAEQIVDALNEELGLQKDEFGFLCPPGSICAMYEHMSELEGK